MKDIVIDLSSYLLSEVVNEVEIDEMYRGRTDERMQDCCRRVETSMKRQYIMTWWQAWMWACLKDSR